MKTSNESCAPTSSSPLTRGGCLPMATSGRASHTRGIANRYTTRHGREIVARKPWHGPGITLGTMLRPVLALCTLTALALGCHAGDSAGEPADLDSARAGWRSTELVMAEAGIDVQVSSSSVNVDENGVSAMMTGSMSCPEGGSLTLDTDTQVTDDLVATHLVLEFDGCGADGAVLDGHLETATEVTDAEVSTSITGELSFSGAAQGTCEIDIGTTVTHEASSSSVSSHASVCGFGYDELLG
jgi:hypothetical protein